MKIKKFRKGTIPKYSILFITISFIIYFVYGLILGYMSENWISTEGRIINIDSGISEGISIIGTRYGSYSMKGGGVYYGFSYEYEHNGKKYISNRIAYHDIIQGGRVGQKITIYYWETFPSFSVIETGIHVDLFIFIVIVFLTMLCVIIFFTYNKINILGG